MSLQLKSPSEMFPPGGFGFRDPKTGMIFNGYEGTAQMIAVKVAAHREANPTFYPRDNGGSFNIDSIVQEIYAQKYAQMPWLFVGGGDYPGMLVSNPTPSGQPGGLCICGASDVDPIYCPTCGGSVIKGYKCRACGAERQ